MTFFFFLINASFLLKSFISSLYKGRNPNCLTFLGPDDHRESSKLHAYLLLHRMKWLLRSRSRQFTDKRLTRGLINIPFYLQSVKALARSPQGRVSLTLYKTTEHFKEQSGESGKATERREEHTYITQIKKAQLKVDGRFQKLTKNSKSINNY